MAGGLLAMDGLRRGGYTGLAEDTAGSAMIDTNSAVGLARRSEPGLALSLESPVY
jgi:hypothetical protein